MQACPRHFIVDIRRRRCAAHTLLEIIFASAITFTLIVSLLSAWTTSTSFAYMVNANLKRMEAIDAIRGSLRNDLNQSAQFVQYNSTLFLASINTTTNENITLYPNIRQNGRELRFVRFRNSLTSNASPRSEVDYFERLASTNSQAMSQFALAPASPCFVINPNVGLPGYWNVAPVWESNLSGLTFAENADPANLRIYRYVLAPYGNIPATLDDSVVWATTAYPVYSQAGIPLRRGMLLRQYRNARSTTWTTIDVLSESVVFDQANSETGALPCFVFASAFDDVVRTGVHTVQDIEVRLKASLAMELIKDVAPTVLDLQFTFAMRRIDYGE